MAVVKQELDCAKEVADVMNLVVELVADLKAKKSLPDFVSENLTHLLAAIEGLDQVDDELAANRKAVLATVGYKTGELADALLAAPAAPAPEAPASAPAAS